jgi:hypothetical protein
VRSIEESSQRKSSSLITGGGRSEKVFIAHHSYYLMWGGLRSYPFLIPLKPLCVKDKKYLSLIIIAWFKMERDKIAKATCIWA